MGYTYVTTCPRWMLDRLDACLYADFRLQCLFILLQLCFFFDRTLYWLSGRVPARLRRALLRLEFRFFNWPWRALQLQEREWQNRLARELAQVQME